MKIPPPQNKKNQRKKENFTSKLFEKEKLKENKFPWEELIELQAI